ncbi:HECT-type E3 ubiquitin-protein ligase [Aspergillus udagawae]|uniref:HECT-type E3 ubiquitin transferase n=1 Tax=Aspergillus udagawae TaxID=91492 RepID=A0A8E0QZM6_9EURO|nr:putative E3 ubiquitin-protein ligase HTD2 [Aspergillus udagawae]GIC94053.1 putative E3 ubiquitin-protein ligase HTD2 [Aspergillus udagawae]
MPSRSAYNQPHPPTLNSSAVYPNAALLSSSAERSAPRHIQHDVHILPTMTGNPATSPPHHRGHSRSISHPFPSAFGGKRRNPNPGFLDSDSDDDDVEVTHLPDVLSSSPRKASSRPLPGGEAISTGKCMTCNSTVRWPRGLKVFRCTECLTVNDLEPYTSKDLGGQGSTGKDGKPGLSIPRKAVPLSVERTRSIIDNCVSSYLRRLLDAPVPQGFTSGNRSKTPSAIGQDENRAHTYDHGSGLLSEPRVDARARSSSASSKAGKPDWFKGASNSLKPTASSLAPHADVRDPRLRSRNNSDVQIPPKGERLPREAGRSSERDVKDQSSNPYIFKPLEEYILASFKGCDSLNVSFSTAQPPLLAENASPDHSPPKPKVESNDALSHAHPAFEIDAKTLLIGDLAENSSWWMNDGDPNYGLGHTHSKGKSSSPSKAVTSRSPRINWSQLAEWHHLIMTAGSSWVERWTGMRPVDERGQEGHGRSKLWDSVDMCAIERDITESRLHLHRAFLKVTENLVKRPRRPLHKPEEIRFLLILLANPLIYPSSSSLRPVNLTQSQGVRRPSHPKESGERIPLRDARPSRKEQLGPSAPRSGPPGHHFGIVKRILGLMAHLPNDCHHYLVSWFSRLPTGQFEKLVDLVGSFVTYRLSRQQGRKRSEAIENDNSLVPSFSSAAGNTPAELHAAINGRSPSKPAKDKRNKPVVYGDDWQIRAAARVMSLLFTANDTSVARKPDAAFGQEASSSTNRAAGPRRGHKIPISAFYNTLLDYSDLVADFEAWESKMAKFSFCQYPYFLSIWAKIHIMEHDARRQMEVKAREAFFNSILSRKAISQYLVLKVRRDCLVDDSLRSVSEVVGSNQEEIKKGLRIEFVGEEGVDAGGLRKEWFLLLVREIFDPHHGLFLYDEDSQFCYFNPYCFESSEQFFLVGVLLGLAIYNSTILDIALPPFAFKKLLAAAPQTSGPQPSSARSNYRCTLDDLAEYRPALAKGLRALLEFDGDVADTFCYDFVAHVDRYGEAVAVPLCPGGETRPVTNANRREFVDLYVHYMLDTAVTRQFEPFKRGFFTVCGGNALSLFRPEEIELLVRGSDEALDVASLRAVATYDNWSHPRPENIAVVRWFWEFFENTDPQAQRKILSFITGSDRIPAMGATSLTIRLACLGDDTPRYPIARTCFNTLGLYRYPTREKLERMLWEAVGNSEGFGLK